MRVGEVAPDFQLPLNTGEDFRLSLQRGSKNVVLYFYPRDFTWGCTREGCLFSSHIKEIERLEAIIIGISADRLESHRDFVREYNLAFALASDAGMTVSKQYGAQRLYGIAIRRLTYVIDKEGIIRGKTHHEVRINRHWDYVLGVLRELEVTRTQ
jgi:thioredoxin-dependent peroxiredoxin